VDSQVVASGFHFLTFHYEARPLTDTLRLKDDEIEAARWVPLEVAASELASSHSKRALEDLARPVREARRA
jgi:hypothetical protein